jgi:hypothetical protein
VGEATQGRLYRVSADGAKRTLVDLPIVRETSTEADKSKYTEDRVKSFIQIFGKTGKANALGLVKQMNFPPLLPGFSWNGLASSSDGGVWVAAFAREDAPVRKWYMVSPTGILRATIDLPRDFDVLDGSDRYLVARRKDPDGGGPVIVLYDIKH